MALLVSLFTLDWAYKVSTVKEECYRYISIPSTQTSPYFPCIQVKKYMWAHADADAHTTYAPILSLKNYNNDKDNQTENF